MQSLVRKKTRREVFIFVVTVIFFTWILWLPALLIKNYNVQFPVSHNAFILAGTFIPSIAGFVFAYIFGGKTELKSLFKSMVNIHIQAKWLLFLFLLLPGVSALSCFIFYILGNTLPQAEFPFWFIPIAFVYILVLMGPLGEEAGWRGFALKRVLKDTSPIKATALIGVIWSIWHLPLFFIDGTTQNALMELGEIPALLGYLLYTLIISFLITLVYIKNSGSVFSSILLHTVGNLSLGVVPLIFDKEGAVVFFVCLCITAAVVFYKYRKIMFEKV